MILITSFIGSSGIMEVTLIFVISSIVKSFMMEIRYKLIAIALILNIKIIGNLHKLK